jgi:hypothetical protein
MPLEIRELVIRVNVTAQTSSIDEADISQTLRNIKEELIEDCIEKVIRKIEKLSER